MTRRLLVVSLLVLLELSTVVPPSSVQAHDPFPTSPWCFPRAHRLPHARWTTRRFEVAPTPFFASFPAYSSYCYFGWPYRPYPWASSDFHPSVPLYGERFFWDSACVPSSPFLPFELSASAVYPASYGALVEETFPVVLPEYGPASLYRPTPHHQEPIVLSPADGAKERLIEGLHRVEGMPGQTTSYKVPVRTLTPSSADWAQSAIGLTDIMLQEGDSQAAYDACARMMEIREQLPAGIYLRYAILSACLSKNSSQAVEGIRLAMESGSRIDRNELPTGSLRQYLSTASNIQLEDTFNRLAKWLLEKERGEDFLVLGVLLRLDGQEDRASRMFREAASRVDGPLQSVAVGLLR